MKRLQGLASLLLLGAGLALGHSEFASADPTPDTVLRTAPSAVTLVFSEPAEVRFSTFKVYRLEEGGSSEAETSAEPTHGHGDEHAATQTSGDPEWLRLNGLAGALVAKVLNLRGDGEARVDSGPQETGQSRTVTLTLREDLAPGVYVVMWRLLSVDTHTTQGYYVFRLEAE